MTVSASLILGIIGNVMSILSHASPLPTFWRIVKTESTGHFNELPYMMSLLNSLFWICYGVLKTNAQLLITVNAAGSAIQLIYLFLYLRYSIKAKKVSICRSLLCVHVVFATLILAVRYGFQRRTRLLVMGVIADAGSVVMLSSPLAILGTVVRTRSVEFMPFLISLSFLLRSGSWSAYGFVVKDIFIVLPNMIGVGLAAIQLMFYAAYRNPKPIKDAPKALDQLLSDHHLPRTQDGIKQFKISAVKSNEYHQSASRPQPQQENSDPTKLESIVNIADNIESPDLTTSTRDF